MDDALLCAMLDRHLVVRQEPHEIDKKASGHDDRSFSVDLRVQGGAQRQLHVGRSEVQPAAFGPKQDAGKNLDTRPGRDCPSNNSELLRELVALSNDFHPRPYYGVGFNHLKPRCSHRGCWDRGGGPPCPWLSHSCRGRRWWTEWASQQARTLNGPASHVRSVPAQGCRQICPHG